MYIVYNVTKSRFFVILNTYREVFYGYGLDNLLGEARPAGNNSI